MVSVTLSIPQETKELMNKFPEMNWSGFIRSCIEEKTRKLSWREEMLKKLKADERAGMIDWPVDRLSKSREERLRELKKKGLL